MEKKRSSNSISKACLRYSERIKAEDSRKKANVGDSPWRSICGLRQPKYLVSEIQAPPSRSDGKDATVNAAAIKSRHEIGGAQLQAAGSAPLPARRCGAGRPGS